MLAKQIMFLKKGTSVISVGNNWYKPYNAAAA